MRLYLLTFLLVLGCGDGEEDMVRIPRPIYDNEPTEPRAAAPVQVITIEPHSGPWSSNPNVGQFREFALTPGNRFSILKMPEWGDPAVRTVTLGFEATDGDVDVDLGVTAEVIVGCGGTTKTFQMDWRNGSSFSLPMNAVEVVAFLNPDSVTTGATEPLRLTAWVGKGVKASNTVTLTSFLKDITTGDAIIPNGSSSTRIKIPNFAKEVRFYDLNTVNTMYNAGNIVYFFPGTVGLVPTRCFTTSIFTPAQAYYIMANEGIRINEFSRYIYFVNLCGADVSGFIEFELDL